MHELGAASRLGQRRHRLGRDGLDRSARVGTGTGQIAGSVQDIGVGYELESQGKGKVLKTFGDFVPKFETHVIFATDDMIAKNPDVVARFLKGWFMTVAYMKHAQSRDGQVDRAGARRIRGRSSARLYDNDMASLSTQRRMGSGSRSAWSRNR